MDIIKASGEKEKFNKKKLEQSLKRAGAESVLAKKVSKEISKKVSAGISSEKILNQTTSYLKKENPILAARYNLKRAIMELGPTGFPFEKYIAEILKAYGYKTKVGKIVKGHCLSHEIDVIAQASSGQKKEHFIIECKYHNKRGRRSDLKVALYIYARFLDIKKVWKKIPGHHQFFHQAWLVTNTKCTSQAIRYARCVGLKIVSWRYPKDESLEYLIEKKGLYPITVLPSLNRYVRDIMAENKIMLAKDLLKYSLNDLVGLTALKPKVVRKLQLEAKELCEY